MILMRVKRSPITNPNRRPMSVEKPTDLNELSFREKSIECKLGLHEYDLLYNGLYEYIGCTKCYKKHRTYQ